MHPVSPHMHGNKRDMAVLVFSMATPTALSSMHEIIGHGGPSKMQPHLSSRNLRGWLHPGLCLGCSSHVDRGHPCRASIGSSWQINSLQSNMEEEGTVVYFKVKKRVTNQPTTSHVHVATSILFAASYTYPSPPPTHTHTHTHTQ